MIRVMVSWVFLKTKCPSLWVCITAWEKNYVEKHASCFSKAELREYHNTASNKEEAHLFQKVYSVIVTSFAARSGEAVSMTWEQIKEVTEDSTGN